MISLLLVIIAILVVAVGFLGWNVYEGKPDGKMLVVRDDDQKKIYSLDFGDTDISTLDNKKRLILEVVVESDNRN